MSKVVVQYRDSCRYCHDAKGFLRGMEITFEEEYQPVGQVTQILVDGKTIGGYEDLLALSQSQTQWDETFNG